MMKTLTLKLVGPLQSYGTASSFDRRDTRLYPSKSAVIGLLGAAMGYRRDDEQALRSLTKLKMAVRIDQLGVVRSDFQTVRYAENKGSKLTYREYIQDAVFVVALTGADATVDRLEYAVHHPVFAPALGRRAAVPAGPIITTITNLDPISVLQSMTWQASSWYQMREQKRVAEIYADAELLRGNASWTVEDNYKSFSQRNRQYAVRQIAKTTTELRGQSGRNFESDDDFFSVL